MTKLKLVIFLFPLFLVTILLSPSVSYSRGVNVNFDFSTFRYDSTRTYMELYYAFDLTELRMARQDSMYADSLIFNIAMRTVDRDSAVVDQYWQVPVSSSDTAADDLKRTFVGQIGLAIPPGKYLMRIMVRDRNDISTIDSMSSQVTIPHYGYRKLETSDVELCSQIANAGDGPHGTFYKNTYDVVPNPRGVYGAGLPIIYYYAEVYNIPDSAGDSLFTVEYQVRDSYGQVKKSRTIVRKKFGDTSVEVGTVNGSDLRTGAYTFTFAVIDSASDEYATSSRRFFVYNPGLGPPVAPGKNLSGGSMLSTVFATMTMDEIDKEFKEAKYIASSKEIKEFDELQSLPAKRQFLYDFWQKRNPDPVSRTNTFRIEYLKRVQYADDHFTVGNTPGWRTDRGRVYIVYGKPDQIDRHPNESNSKPYEIWYYNSIQGGVSFDFVDRTGFGNYTLVNSTARNEVHDDNWQQYLDSSGY